MKQPHEMTDIELNRAMIWCYHKGTIRYAAGMDFCVEVTQDFRSLDYIDDYNQTMPLAFNNGVNIHVTFSDSNKFRAYEQNARFSATRETPLRAICEVLVAIAMEKAK